METNDEMTTSELENSLERLCYEVASSYQGLPDFGRFKVMLHQLKNIAPELGIDINSKRYLIVESALIVGYSAFNQIKDEKEREEYVRKILPVYGYKDREIQEVTEIIERRNNHLGLEREAERRERENKNK
jgi:hypothetical protein